MALNAEDISRVKILWLTVAAHVEETGKDTLYRLFLTDPSTKVYFPGCNKNFPQIQAQDKKVVDARTEAVKHLDNIDGAQCDLNNYGRRMINSLTEFVNNLGNPDAPKCNRKIFDLSVDRGNFPLLAHHILVTIAGHFPDKLDCSTQQSLGKVLDVVGDAL